MLLTKVASSPVSSLCQTSLGTVTRSFFLPRLNGRLLAAISLPTIWGHSSVRKMSAMSLSEAIRRRKSGKIAPRFFILDLLKKSTGSNILASSTPNQVTTRRSDCNLNDFQVLQVCTKYETRNTTARQHDFYESLQSVDN